jgi:hypothetical protein
VLTILSPFVLTCKHQIKGYGGNNLFSFMGKGFESSRMGKGFVG